MVYFQAKKYAKQKIYDVPQAQQPANVQQLLAGIM